jgi:hypothetical protein
MLRYIAVGSYKCQTKKGTLNVIEVLTGEKGRSKPALMGKKIRKRTIKWRRANVEPLRSTGKRGGGTAGDPGRVYRRGGYYDPSTAPDAPGTITNPQLLCLTATALR